MKGKSERNNVHEKQCNTNTNKTEDSMKKRLKELNEKRNKKRAFNLMQK